MRGLGPAARRRKIEAAREHLLRASWACLDVGDALQKRGLAGGLTAGERAELVTTVDAATLAGRARGRLDELLAPAPAEVAELEGQEPLELDGP